MSRCGRAVCPLVISTALESTFDGFGGRRVAAGLRQRVEPFVERTGVVWGGYGAPEGTIVQPTCLVTARVYAGRGSRNA
jgi:hypothetical protein